MSFGKDHPILLNRGRHRAKRPKTFASEQNAIAYAQQKGLKKYKIVNIKLSDQARPKFKVVAE